MLRLPSPRLPARRRGPATLVGLQIEPGSVAAVAGRPGTIGVERAGEAALEPHVVRDGEVVDGEALAAVLRGLFDEHGLDRRVRIGVANGQLVLRTLELPPIDDPKALAAAVRFQAGSELPMRLEDAVLDFHAMGVVDTPAGPRQRVVVAAARRDMVERILGAARAAGLRPEGVDLAAFAMVRAVAPATEEPVLVAAVGGLTNLAIAHRGICLFCRVAGGGLEQAAQVLAERAAVPVDEARSAIAAARLDGSAAADSAAAVLAESIRRVGAEARATIDVHLATQPEAPVARVILTGAALELPGYAQALEAEVGLPVLTAGIDGAPDASGGRYAVAAGLTVAEAPGA